MRQTWRVLWGQAWRTCLKRTCPSPKQRENPKKKQEEQFCAPFQTLPFSGKLFSRQVLIITFTRLLAPSKISSGWDPICLQLQLELWGRDCVVEIVVLLSLPWGEGSPLGWPWPSVGEWGWGNRLGSLGSSTTQGPQHLGPKVVLLKPMGPDDLIETGRPKVSRSLKTSSVFSKVRNPFFSWNSDLKKPSDDSSRRRWRLEKEQPSPLLLQRELGGHFLPTIFISKQLASFPFLLLQSPPLLSFSIEPKQKWGDKPTRIF